MPLRRGRHHQSECRRVSDQPAGGIYTSKKDEHEPGEFSVEIEKDSESARIRVVGVRVGKSSEEFDQAYRLTAELSQRARQLDTETEEESKVKLANKRVSHLWHKRGEEWKLDSSVRNATHRIALSLLRRHPSCITQADVVKETDVPQKTVSNHLGGRKKSVRLHFSKCDGGHRLSAEGIQWLVDKAIPAVLGERSSGRGNLK